MSYTPYSYRTYAGDGSKVDFAVPYAYLKRAHVQVLVDDVLKVDGTDYNWTSDVQVQFTAAPASGTEIVVARETPESDQIVQWDNGSYIIAEDLNESDLQWLYNIQELYDKVEKLDGTIEGSAVKEIIGTLPVLVDSTDNQKPVISVDLIKKADAEKDPTNPSWDTDDKLASPAAIDRIYKQIVGNGSGYPGSGNKGKLGQIRIDNTGSTPEMFYWDTATTAWIQVKVKGDQGPQGPAGPPPGLQSPPADATNVPLKPGNVLGDATASVTQDSAKDLKFSFGIPVGKTGATGPQGPTAPPVVISQPTQPTFADDTIWFNTNTGRCYFGYTDPSGDEYWVSISVPGPEGKAATVDVGKTDTGSPGTSATVKNVGTTSAAIFDFVIPKGEPGKDGTDGKAATISVGTTTTLAAGSNATVNNSGDSTAAVFNFGIPKGDKGDKGDTSDPVVISQSAKPTFAEDTIWFNTTNAEAYFGYKDTDGDEYWVSLSKPGPPGPKSYAEISDTAPTTPADGQIWIDSIRGKAYSYWSSQTVWVQM